MRGSTKKANHEKLLKRFTELAKKGVGLRADVIRRFGLEKYYTPKKETAPPPAVVEEPLPAAVEEPEPAPEPVAEAPKPAPKKAASAPKRKPAAKKAASKKASPKKAAPKAEKSEE